MSDVDPLGVLIAVGIVVALLFHLIEKIRLRYMKWKYRKYIHVHMPICPYGVDDVVRLPTDEEFIIVARYGDDGWVKKFDKALNK